jgi:Uma2 family endonuclease
MNETPEATLITTEELLALPEDGMDRDLIRGELREKPMTRRNRPHSGVTARVTYLLEAWRILQPKPRGEVLCGEAGFRIRRDPDTTVGIDVAYISAQLAANTPENVKLIDGPPVLAVEILSPSDKHEEITEKVQEYLNAGVALVWVIDPVLRTVTVCRPDAAPVLFNVHQELTAEPHLPGFRVAVAEIFES